MRTIKSEKGQALIVIALAAVVLFSFAALAIDGSMAFSDRRKAQTPQILPCWLVRSPIHEATTLTQQRKTALHQTVMMTMAQQMM